ncbi:glycerol-3-phosphate dehydrogenase/oxidase [bacterium]|nr:glycerol-3-phosphate dehydrogenase/oxidase [bacterium]
MFNAHARQKTIDNLNKTNFDLLIVGGGITGAGVAREAVQRGLKVLLLEAKDFAFGTSSRSSKLVHGGIRYLENFEFGLVHEALMERRNLLQMAPQMVHPLRFLIPIYKKSRVGLFKMEAGMILYDLLSFFEAPKMHEFHFKKQTQLREPLIRKNELVGSVVYSDAYMEDDRLVVETLRSAHRSGAEIANYASVESCVENKNGYSVQVCDVLTGKKYQVQADHVVGCVGPWTDIFGDQAMADWKPVLRPTKGVHLVFARERFPVQQAIVMAVETRIVFVIPREDIVIVGTTDTDFQKNPEDVITQEQDVTYLLKAANDYFPDLALTKKDIISCYSGVRPLVKDGASSEGKTSREHQIFTPRPNLTLVAGGKYTTYRSMAEEITDVCLRNFSFEQKMLLKQAHTVQPLNPGATVEKIERLNLLAASIAEEMAVPQNTVEYLINRRGEDALIVLNLMQLFKEGSVEDRLWLAEAKFCLQNEMCLNLVDFYCRRTPLFLFRKNQSRELAHRLAPLFNSLVDGQIKALEQLVERETAAIKP